MKQISDLELSRKIAEDFLKIYVKALKSPYIRKPISYSLYNLWKKYDNTERAREVEEQNWQ